MYYYTSAHGLSYGGAAPERASLPGPMHRRHFATPPVGQCADGAGPRSPQAREPCPLFCHFLRVCACAGGTGSRSVARLAKYCGLVKRQTGHAFLNAQWVCLLMKFTKQHLFVIKVAGVMKSLFVYLLLNSLVFLEKSLDYLHIDAALQKCQSLSKVVKTNVSWLKFI